MNITLNLTQHEATPDQISAGVVDPTPELKSRIKHLLDFNSLPSVDEITNVAQQLAMIVAEFDCDSVMIGGALFLMAPLQHALAEACPNKEVLFAFSVRDSVETTLPDGSVKKSVVFKHVGFVKAN